jgi:hypothetical protein
MNGSGLRLFGVRPRKGFATSVMWSLPQAKEG